MKPCIYFLFFFLISSCISKEESFLNKGLYNLQNKRPINEEFIKNFSLITFGIIKSSEHIDTYDLIFLLNDDVDKLVVENYSLSIRVVPIKAEMLKNNIIKPELFWDFKPKLIDKNGHKYMIHTIKTKIKKIKEFRFALYHRSGYQGKTLSKAIKIKNISLY